MSDGFDVLQGLMGGSIGATVLGVVFLITKCFKERRCHSKSGCIDIDISNATPKRNEVNDSFQPPRTPVPSLEIKVDN
jgi:hypothetical protein